jgi:Fe2+ transport system protein FeoA
MDPVSADSERRAGVPLTCLSEGELGVVVELLRTDASVAAELVAVGVLPGARIRLIQRYPSFIFEIGHTEFAVDEGLAGSILVSGV